MSFETLQSKIEKKAHENLHKSLSEMFGKFAISHSSKSFKLVANNINSTIIDTKKTQFILSGSDIIEQIKKQIFNFGIDFEIKQVTDQFLKEIEDLKKDNAALKERLDFLESNND